VGREALRIEAAENCALISPPVIERFLHYYDDALAMCDGKLGVFSLPGAATFVSRDAGAIARRAANLTRDQRDVYLHIHVHDLPEGEISHRGSIQSVRAAIGVFGDIDAHGPGRKKPPETLCPTVADAMWVVEQFNATYRPAQVSFAIKSGHGCYPVILFKEPLLVTTPEDAALLESLGRRFHSALQSIAGCRGWTGAVDYCDPAKVLRLPGCVNWKDARNPKPVRLAFECPARFNVSELDELLPQLVGATKVPSVNRTESGDIVAGEILLQPAVQLASDWLDALADNHPLFAPTWTHRREDLTDQSCSGYDMALTGIAVACGLTDQQIADILVVHRREFPHDKQPRQGRAYVKYLQRTIARAREGQQSSDAAAESWGQFVHQAPDCGAADHSVDAGGGQVSTDAEPAKQSSADPDPEKKLVEARKRAHVPSPDEAYARLHSLLAEAQDTGMAGPLFDASVLLAVISDGHFSDFIGAVKRSVAESNTGFHIDLNLLKKARRIAALERARGSRWTQPGDTAEPSPEKPRIMVSDRQLSDLRAEAVCRLKENNEPPVVFQRLRELVRFRVDAMQEPFLETLDEKSLRGRLADVASFYEEVKNGERNAFPPRALCEDILAYDHAPNTFPVVEAITRSPIVRADGSIFSSPGFDPITHVILTPPPGFVLPPIPVNPTKEEVEAAKELLLDLVVDFLFEDGADRANFFGFCITTLIRQQVDVVPMCVFDSPVPGSGKGLLTDLASIIATGEVAAVIPPPATREEWPKLLASLLDNGRTFITFDNLHDTLKSDALEAVLTKPFLQFRQLGHTRERIVPNRAVWCVTGNNVAVSRDMVRRCYRVRIDPRCSQPHLRKDFKHPNLVAHCKADRANLLAALLVLIRAWHAAGKPAFGGTQLGTYTAWKETVGGILKCAGFEDFLGNQRKLYAEMDQESEEWETLWLQLHDHFGDEDFSIKEFIPLIDSGALVLPREVAKIYGQTTSHVGARPNPYFAVQLGHVLRSRRGTRYGSSEVYLERSAEDRRAKTVRYRIRRGDQY
jgi:hypothetical protein